MVAIKIANLIDKDQIASFSVNQVSLVAVNLFAKFNTIN